MLKSCRVLIVVVAVGCSPTAPAVPITPTAEFATVTLLPSPVPSVAGTAAAPASTIAPTPVVGTTTTQLNVRAEPQAAGAPLGVIPASATVQIIRRAPGGDWYEIVHGGGSGWVASQYVSVSDEALIPAAGGIDGAAMASVREQIFVRAGPGTSFETLGTQSARDVVRLAGKNAAGTWIQIEFSGGPDEKGWVAASFLEGAPLDRLSIVDEGGQVVGTATPTGTAPAPTPTVAAARRDGDSPESPIVDVRFNPAGIGSFLYVGEVSAPDGDTDDWIRFQPYSADLTFRLECSGNSTLSLQLIREGQAIQTGEELGCGKTTLISLEPGGLPYTLRLSAMPADGGLGIVRYSIRIANSP